MKAETHDLAYYMALPYTKTLRLDEDGDVVARIRELPGYSAHGQTELEALRNLEEAQRLWLEDCIESADPVPEPDKPESLPSGKWVQRVPRSLHRQLSQMAKDENVSLNQLVTSMLSQRVGMREGEPASTARRRAPASRWIATGKRFRLPKPVAKRSQK
jgi:antitoxin HicB